MKHSDKASRSDVRGFAYLGENLAFGDGVAGAKAVEMWYSEIKDTDGGRVTGFDHKTGHYTQNVWKASIALGCGEKGKLVVCQYGPGGNSGNYAENVLPPTKSEDACQAEGDNDEGEEGNNDEAAEGSNNDEGEGNDNEEAQGNNDEKAKGNNDYYYSKGGDKDEGEGGNDEGEEGNNDEGEEGNNDEEAKGNNDEEPEPCGKVSAPTPGGPLADVYLKAHNKYRCMHGVPCMTWNEEIAKNAQKWADATGGQMKHSDKTSRQDVGGFSYLGENLAFGDGVAGAKAVEMWYSEIKDTDGGRVTGFDHKTGHYTQNVWKASIALGCGEKGKLVVCQYGPGGNSGNYAENVLPPTKSEDACQAEGDSDEPEGNNDEEAEGNNNDE